MPPLADHLKLMAQGKIITCGVWSYLAGVQLTCRGYDTLLKQGVTIRRAFPDALDLRIGEKAALIGMTPALRKKLQMETWIEGGLRYRWLW